MNDIGRVLGVLGAALALAVGSAACGPDSVPQTGTSSLTVEIANLVGAEGSQLQVELTQSVDYLQKAPVWTLLATEVSASPFTATDTVEQLPEGEFSLSVLAGMEGTPTVAQVKGQGCETSVVLGRDDHVTLVIDGLNEFGDKGYGPCRVTRK